MPAMALFTSIGTSSSPHHPRFVQNSTCTLPPSVPCFRCRCSYSIIVSLTDSHHMLFLTAAFWWYHTIADGQLSLSQDTSCRQLHAMGSGTAISWPHGRIPGRCAPTVSSCFLSHLWVFADRFVSVSSPTMKCSAPRRQRAWLSVRLDSSLGFCLIHAPCFVWQ